MFLGSMNKFTKLNKKSQDYRSTQLDVVWEFFTHFGVTANHLTFLRFWVGPLYVILFPTRPMTMFLVLLVAMLVDLLDGGLARYQNKAGDRGKFWDVLVDHTNYVLPIFALLFFPIVSPINIAYHLLILPIVFLLATIKESEFTKTDWIIHPHYSIVYLKPAVNTAVGFWVAGWLNYVDQTIFFVNILMTLMACYYAIVLAKRWKK